MVFVSPPVEFKDKRINKKSLMHTSLNLITTLITCILITFLSPTQGFSGDRVYLDITSPEARKINFAIPWFSNKDEGKHNSQIEKDLADTLAKAFKFHGIISIIPTASYGGSQTANWKQLGADFTILGNYTLSDQILRVELRLLDVATGDMLMGKSYNGTLKHQDRMMFKFCDSAIKELTGEKGIASTQIAFVLQKNRKKEAYISDILGRSVRRVTRHNNLVVSPRFTPDGVNLSYTSYHSGNQNLYITDLRQNKTTRVLSRRRGMNLAPAWAPNGRKMVLTLSKNGNPDLFLLDNKGKILDQITKNAGINVSPSFSPDGKHLAFVSDRSGRPQVYLMELRTKKVQRLTYSGSENAEPSWSPKENLLVYSSLTNGLYQLFTIEPSQGAQPNQITHDLSHHESPAWSPDGNQIIFSKRDGAEHKIYGIMKNGSYQRKLFSLPGNQSYPQWSKKQK